MAELHVRPLVGVLVLAFLVFGAAIGPAQATTIDLFAGKLDAQLFVDVPTASILALDVRGTGLFLVVDPGIFFGVVLATDMFDFVTPATFPNTVILVKNQAFDQSALLLFDENHLEASGDDLMVPAFGVPVGSVTDAALASMLGPLRFFFVFDPTESGIDPSIGKALFNYDLVRIVIPGPASLLLLTIGALAPALARLRSRQ